MIVHTLISSAGSLEVFTKHEQEAGVITADLPGFYWSDKHSSHEGIGPFLTVHDAMQDHVKTLESRQYNGVVFEFPGGNQNRGVIIEVDFVNKRRIA